MIRKIAAIALAVSFVAMSTSGLAMFIIEKPSFTLQMHPVHKLFGLVMIAAALTHITLNRRALFAHLRNRAGALIACVATAALIALYAVALNNEIPADLAEQMDSAAAQAEGHE